MRPILASLVFIYAAAPLHAANWDQFLKASFGAADVGEGSACYARVYDAKHLAAHKGQRIGDVAVRLVMRRENGERRLDWDLATHFVGAKQLYWSNGACNEFDGLKAHCYVEGDGGSVDLTLAADGASATARFDTLRVWRPQDAADESDMTIDRAPQDRVARLDKAPQSMCGRAGN